MLTGEPFPIFQDREDIVVGQVWKERIVNEIDSSSLLIAVLTPNFFRSDRCRGEVERFLERESTLGRDDLIVPILYVDSREMGDSSDDDIGVTLRQRQYFDWRELRFEPVESRVFRENLEKLARGISKVAGSPISSATPDHIKKQLEEVDDSPGPIDLIADLEEAFPAIPAILDEISEGITDVGSLAQQATKEMSHDGRQGQTAKAKVVALQKFASRLEEPTHRISGLSAQYRDLVERTDAGIGALAHLTASTEDEDNLESARTLMVSLQELEISAVSGVAQVERLRQILREQQSLSRSIRSIYKSLDNALSPISDSLLLIKRWPDLIAESLAPPTTQDTATEDGNAPPGHEEEQPQHSSDS